MRTRITVVVALLVALALTAAGLIIYFLGSAGIERDAQARADQEIEAFRALRDEGPEPGAGGRGFASVNQLLTVFLERNVASDDELIVAWVDGQARSVSASRHTAAGGGPGLRGRRGAARRGWRHRAHRLRVR